MLLIVQIIPCAETEVTELHSPIGMQLSKT